MIKTIFRLILATACITATAMADCVPSFASAGDDPLPKTAGVAAIYVCASVVIVIAVKFLWLDTMGGWIDKGKRAGEDLIDKASVDLVDKTDAAITVHREEVVNTVNKAIDASNKLGVYLDGFNPVGNANAPGWDAGGSSR